MGLATGLSLLAAVLLAGCVRAWSGGDDATDASGFFDLFRVNDGDLAVEIGVADDGGLWTDGSGPPPAWITLPGGDFYMGSPTKEACRQTNETRHLVTLSRGVEIQSTEVTQGQYAALTGKNPSQLCARPDCPVETVSWHEAAHYCNRLSETLGKALCYECTVNSTTQVASCALHASFGAIYDCPGYRLPTEAEWEYAARAGTTDPSYGGPITQCKGSDPIADIIGWYTQNSGDKTHAVGLKLANPAGLHDMQGNVLEWTHDRYAANLGSAHVKNPVGSTTGSARSVRGGAWGFTAATMRSAYRDGYDPANSSGVLGLRCARTLK